VESLRILVTGGAGFIGSHLVKALVKAGHSVRVLDNFSTGSLENLGDIAGSVELVVGDVRSYGVVEKAVKGVDAVIHLAALIDVAESIEKPDLYFDVNARGTYNIAKACKGVSVLVFASTCAVYGEPVKLPVAEDCTIAPKSPYAAAKVAGEAFIQAYSNLYGYRYAILRLFNVYGPKQSKAYAGVIIEFIKRVSRGEPPIIFGDGEQTRDFIHVSDVVEAIIMAITNEKARGVFNIGSGKPVTINQLAKLILKLMGREDLKPIHTTPRPGDIRHSVADITKAREALGFKPRIGLEEGLQSLITTYTHQQKHYNSTHCK
jgi:UDP-glucose 4-epimerase